MKEDISLKEARREDEEPLTKILMVVIRMKIARQHSLRNAHVSRIETDAPFRQFSTYISEPKIRVHAVHTQSSFHQS